MEKSGRQEDPSGRLSRWWLLNQPASASERWQRRGGGITEKPRKALSPTCRILPNYPRYRPRNMLRIFALARSCSSGDVARPRRRQLRDIRAAAAAAVQRPDNHPEAGAAARRKNIQVLKDVPPDPDQLTMQVHHRVARRAVQLLPRAGAE